MWRASWAEREPQLWLWRTCRFRPEAVKGPEERERDVYREGEKGRVRKLCPIAMTEIYISRCCVDKRLVLGAISARLPRTATWTPVDCPLSHVECLTSTRTPGFRHCICACGAVISCQLGRPRYLSLSSLLLYLLFLSLDFRNWKFHEELCGPRWSAVHEFGFERCLVSFHFFSSLVVFRIYSPPFVRDQKIKFTFLKNKNINTYLTDEIYIYFKYYDINKDTLY